MSHLINSLLSRLVEINETNYARSNFKIAIGCIRRKNFPIPNVILLRSSDKKRNINEFNKQTRKMDKRWSLAGSFDNNSLSWQQLADAGARTVRAFP